jgi:hypothetical protein
LKNSNTTEARYGREPSSRRNRQGQARHIYGPLVGFVVFMGWAYLLAPLLLVGAQVIAVLKNVVDRRSTALEQRSRIAGSNVRSQAGRQSGRRLGLRATQAAETINTTI